MSFEKKIPPDVEAIVLESIESQKDMSEKTGGPEGSKGFFTPKTENKFVNFLVNDKSICKKLNLQQLISALDGYIPESDKATKLLALKNIEYEIIDINLRGYRSDEKKDLKIDESELQEFLKERFGVVGLINTNTLINSLEGSSPGENSRNIDEEVSTERARSQTRPQFGGSERVAAAGMGAFRSERTAGDTKRAVSLAPLFALQMLLQQKPNEYQESLELANHLFKTQFRDVPRGMVDNAATVGFKFENNELFLVLSDNTGNTAEGAKLSLDDIILRNDISSKVEQEALKILHDPSIVKVHNIPKH